jgi:hypothetical protein
MSPICSVYSQVLQLFPRGQLANAVKQHQAELSAKGFTSWEQFARFLVSLYRSKSFFRSIHGAFPTDLLSR